ncbi:MULTISPECIES: reverse transcriptase family protein [unclassified Caulobacter]|uniref:reverse transcriptase family protein n=2 Tax=Alphaproteobacteria TaxID=28211 RepID=UPI000780BE10|nr:MULTISPECIES: reverse transcriptase family protein [unclassified Caulobacter]PIB96255.1 RNA-directed DNA polymerase [Caulobacter sp. X]
MSSWNPQHYRFDGERQGVPGAVIDSALAIMERIRRVDPRMTPVFTLRHLSEMTGTRYGLLRSVVARRTHPYKVFTLKKAIPGRTRVRLICTPNRELKTTQDWIVRNILQHTRAHPASYAYHPGSRPEFAARMHCGCDFLLKVDIEDFFTRVTEGKICEVFEGLGYPDLIAFELARLTTVVASGGKSPSVDPAVRWPTIKAYQHAAEGFLPQGAPTSPMLSNLVMRHLDDRFAAMAAAANMKYTRYADDLAFSARKPHTRATVAAFKRKVLRELSEAGYRPNLRKTAIRGPGARRIVLGMLVDGPEPRLSREFKDDLRQHLHYLASEDFGPSRHAERQKLSVSTLYHRVRGLIGWAMRVEPKFGAKCLAQFEAVAWPPIDIRSPINAIDWDELA